MDIETYNYYDSILHLYRAGKLTEEKDKAKQGADGEDMGLNAGVVF